MSVNYLVELGCRILADRFSDFLNSYGKRTLAELNGNKISDLYVVGRLGGFAVNGDECTVASVVRNSSSFDYSCDL